MKETYICINTRDGDHSFGESLTGAYLNYVETQGTPLFEQLLFYKAQEIKVILQIEPCTEQ